MRRLLLTSETVVDQDSMDTVSKVVMIADTDHQVRQLVSHFLTGTGYTVEYALDGYEALDRARAAPPDVVLADILLPRLDGLALCRLLKGDPATEDVTVIIFSVLASEERALKAGADAFTHKPLEKNRLLKVLEQATRKRNTIA